ncbi:hypothetical protein Geu3261_0456_001 [Komagataeibacter europaeus NBRC 3261]|uniref:YcfA family protein n=2 Tax=Komagataeibacter europaeus TaxID=33995 RepID=A0A0D6Q5R8_KOMEU|nr:hypothetical protein Geu3261_0456_001 [Komagataeibacter europaeus NBRC 3261]
MQGMFLTQKLIRLGRVLDRVRGSHHVLKHPQRKDVLTIPHPKKNLGNGLVIAICRQAEAQKRSCATQL